MHPDQSGDLISFLAVALVLILFFILFRRFVLWYWTLDKIEKHLAEIVNLLRETPTRRTSGGSDVR